MALAHHSLVAWQRANDLFIKLHQLSMNAFPAFERYELGGQLRRAAFSVPSNIVEGFATAYQGKRLHFLDTARASLAEVAYCVETAAGLGYITEEQANSLVSEIKQVGAPLTGLIRAERRRDR